MKEIKKLLHIVALVGVISTSAIAQTTTTTTTVNGNTTTTVITTKTPITSTPVPNSPNFGDITTFNTTQVDTTTNTQILNQNTGNVFQGTNFCNGGWTGTQITNSPSGQTSDLGCGYLTGKGTSSYAENNKDLLSIGISKVEQNHGFTQSASASTHHFWNWNTYLNFSHSVINNDTGEKITQNRILQGNNTINGGNPGIKYLDNIIIGTNSASGFTSNMRFDFSSSQGGGWTGVDVTAPNLSITYTGLTSQFSSLLEYTTTVQTCESLGTCYVPPAIVLPDFLTPAKGAEPIELISEEEIKQIFKEEFAKVGLTEADIGMSDLDYKEVAKEINTQAVADMKEANPTLFGSPEPTPTTTSSSSMNTTSDDKPTTKESSNVNSNSETTTKTSSTTTEKTETSTAKSTTSEDTKTEGSSSKTSSSENVSNEKGSTTASGTVNTSNATPKDEKISVNVKAAVDKVERELKSIGDKTKAIQEIKIDGIKAGAPSLGAYENRSFYEPKYYNGVPNPDFYLQADIAQKPVYENVSLVAYISKDPIGKQQAAMQEIQDEMNDIIIQLEELKRK